MSAVYDREKTNFAFSHHQTLPVFPRAHLADCFKCWWDNGIHLLWSRSEHGAHHDQTRCRWVPVGLHIKQEGSASHCYFYPLLWCSGALTSSSLRSDHYLIAYSPLSVCLHSFLCVFVCKPIPARVKNSTCISTYLSLCQCWPLLDCAHSPPSVCADLSVCVL